MTTKTSKMILYSSIVFTLMLFTVNIDSVYAEKPADKTDYVSLWKVIDAEMRENQKKIEALELQLENNEYKSSKEKNQIEQTTNDYKETNLNLWTQVDELEKLNIESYKVDPETEKKFVKAEQKLRDKYLNKDSDTYIGVNGVQELHPNYKMREIFVLFDTSGFIKDGFSASQIQSVVSEIISTVNGEVDVNVEFGKIEEVSSHCASRTSPCNPGKGGIQIQRSGVGGGSTLAYKATHPTHGNGFVITKHEANAVDTTIVQPLGGSTYGTAKVLGGPYCDCAFVKLAAGKSVENKIWAPEVGSTYPIGARVPDSAHVPGTFLNLSGVGSGVKYGDIEYLTSNNGVVKIGVVGGDSSAPLYKPLPSGNADLYGQVWGQYGSTKAFYDSWAYTKSQLSLSD